MWSPPFLLISTLWVFSSFFSSVVHECAYLVPASPEAGTGNREMSERPILYVQSPCPLKGSKQIWGGKEAGNLDAQRSPQNGLKGFSHGLRHSPGPSWNSGQGIRSHDLWLLPASISTSVKLASNTDCTEIFFLKNLLPLGLSCWNDKPRAEGSQRKCKLEPIWLLSVTLI